MSVSKPRPSLSANSSSCGSAATTLSYRNKVRNLTTSADSTGKNNFGALYALACVKYSTRLSHCVKISDKKNSVEITGDRMKADDWQAAMEALSNDTVTHHVLIKNRRHPDIIARSYDTLSSALSVPKNTSASSTLYVVNTIAGCLCEMLSKSHALLCLEVENIMFDCHALKRLLTGISANSTLQHLSLAYCRLGDDDCVSLCRTLRDKPNVRSLDLTGCALSPFAGKNGVVDLIKKQQVRRHEECWVHSLRSRSANPDAMQGLRRLTLNNNPTLGDNGVADLLESLKDDFYVKAVDVQNCGLTDRGAQLALSTLMVNNTLVVLDLRRNPNVSGSMLDTIMTRLYENNTDVEETKRWKWTKLRKDNAFKSTSSSIR
ncbi:centrosomal protein of 78 kDa [Adelges cooleyi]|uniref:centrosomal protein of 78 kDa n=1 Tax=Adelges cooleyi TaxID=133065 RepID=UPI0021800503|nr:centrosomal protein of 78 kDa [Adelges cooleyi]